MTTKEKMLQIASSRKGQNGQMAEVRSTIQAADDFEAIVKFVASDSKHYAQ